MKRQFGSWSNKKGSGETLPWLKAHISFNGPDCLIWPYSRNTNGHGHLSIDGKLVRAHRVMCELVNGPPPTPEHEAAHSCGRGHEACVHPKHLGWKTKVENRADREAHNRKPKTHRYRLTEADVLVIRTLEGNETNTAIAERYGVARTTIRAIFAGETWRHGYDPCGIRAKAANVQATVSQGNGD
jgi:hypothetical protein